MKPSKRGPHYFAHKLEVTNVNSLASALSSFSKLFQIDKHVDFYEYGLILKKFDLKLAFMTVFFEIYRSKLCLFISGEIFHSLEISEINLLSLLAYSWTVMWYPVFPPLKTMPWNQCWILKMSAVAELLCMPGMLLIRGFKVNRAMFRIRPGAADCNSYPSTIWGVTSNTRDVVAQGWAQLTKRQDQRSFQPRSSSGVSYKEEKELGVILT